MTGGRVQRVAVSRGCSPGGGARVGDCLVGCRWAAGGLLLGGDRVVGGGEELHLPKRAVPAPAIQTTAAQASAVTATVTVVGIRLIGLLVWVAGSRIWRPLADRRSGWQQSGKQASRHRLRHPLRHSFRYGLRRARPAGVPGVGRPCRWRRPVPAIATGERDAAPGGDAELLVGDRGLAEDQAKHLAHGVDIAAAANASVERGSTSRQRRHVQACSPARGT